MQVPFEIDKKTNFAIADIKSVIQQNYNAESFEAVVLGSIMLNEKLFDSIKDRVSPIMFSNQNAVIASAIFEILEITDRVRKYAIIETAAKEGKIVTEKEVDELRYQANEEDFEEAVYRVIQNWFTKSTAFSSLFYISDIQRGIDVSTAYALFEKRNQEIEDLKEGFKNQELEWAQKLDREYERLIEIQNSDTGIQGIPSGFSDLDLMIGGFEDGNLYEIVGNSGSGKSTFALQIINHVSESCPSCFISLEMSDRQIIQKLFSAKTGYSILDLKNGNFDPVELAKYKDELKKNKFKIIGDVNSLSMIRKEIKKAVKRDGAKLICIDHLGIINAEIGKIDPIKGYELITYELKSIAKQLNVPIILLAQQNRTSAGRANKRPTNADMKYAGEAAADVILFTYRPDYNEADEEQQNNLQEESNSEIVITKNREVGKTGFLRYIFVNRFNSFCPIDSNGHAILPKGLKKKADNPEWIDF